MSGVSFRRLIAAELSKDPAIFPTKFRDLVRG